MKEKLSALLDAELQGPERDRILNECRKDKDLRRLWQRYHLIGAALRKELEVMPAPNLAERIVKNLQDTAAEDRRSKLNVLFQESPKKFYFASAAFASLLALIVPLMMLGPAFFGDQRSSNPAATVAENREQENALNAFLIEHNELTPISNMNGIMPYVRIAGYDTNPE